MNVVQLPQQLRSCSNVTRNATTATLGVATGSNKTEASQRSAEEAAAAATAAVAANQVCIMWMQPSCN